MSSYEQYLKEKLIKEEDQKRIEGRSKMNENVRNYEELAKKTSASDTKKRDEMTKKEISDIQNETEKTLRDIERKKEKQEETFRKLESEMRRNGEEKIAESLKGYTEIIKKNTNEQEIERMEIEKNLRENGSKLQETEKKILEARMKELEENLKKMEELIEKQTKKEEERHEELVKETLNGLRERRNVEMEVAEKTEEYGSKEVALRQNKEEQALAVHAKTFQTLTIRNDQHNAGILNDFIDQMREKFDETVEEYNTCLRFCVNGIEWTTEKTEKAKNSFDALNSKTYELSEQMTIIKRKLSDVEDTPEVKAKIKSISEINKTLRKLGVCIAPFSGRFMFGNTTRFVEEENVLRELMETLSGQIDDFGTFNARNAEMRRHLEPSKIGESVNNHKAIGQ